MINKKIVSELEKIVGKKNVIISKEELVCYSYDATLKHHMPDIVVKPATSQQVSAIMKLANKHRVPVTPRGCGTGLSGGSVPVKGGIIMSLTRMNKILEIDKENMLAVVQPGVINLDLDTAVGKVGLFYPPDPASKNQCSMGGNVAECAGGLRGLKYGVTRDYIIALEVVMPNGDIIRTGARTVKAVTGYDFTKLFVGSEGTLGTITEITVKLLPIPEHKETMMATFKEIRDAGQTVSNIIAAGVIPSTLEFLDNATINTIEDFKHLGLNRTAAAMLLIETDGYKEATTRQMNEIIRICKETGAIEIKKANNETEREDLWAGRRSALAAITRLNPSLLQEDIVVPRSKVAEAAVECEKIWKKYGLRGANYGHAGDGNLHPSILTDERNKEEMAKAKKAIREFFELAIKLGGTLSGEHGIGTEKAPFLDLEVSPEFKKAMMSLKKAWDPNDILNPGKIFYGGRY